MVHSCNPPVYEVGFDPDVGESLGTFTVDGADLEEMKKMDSAVSRKYLQ
jgi:hypothetical protein